MITPLIPSCLTIHGSSKALRQSLSCLKRVAHTRCTVLITGESGTGKELFAKALHDASPRQHEPFVALNCAAIPESMIEAELFGHVRGSFTGASQARGGRIAAAQGGTLFLDEIGDMTLSAQAKLLRVLQEGMITPVGSDTEVPVDVRVVAATHRDLEQMVAAGTFRTDLFFRLTVVPIHLPPLRERGDDIIELAHHFLKQATQRHGAANLEFNEDALLAMRNYSWPGNVRELAHKVERAVLMTLGDEIAPADLNLGHTKVSTVQLTFNQTRTLPRAIPENDQNLWAEGTEVRSLPETSADLDLKRALERVEKTMIEQALMKTGGNRTEAAALLGLNRTTLCEKIRKFAA